MDQDESSAPKGAWIFTWPQVKDFVTKAANVCNVIASFGVIFAVAFFISGQRDRETQEEASAWAALANPRPGISVSRQLEYLSKDGWFRSASTFDDVHLVPENGESGISLNGLHLTGSSLENVKADRASMKAVKIEGSVMSRSSLRRAYISESEIINVEMIKSNIQNITVINSEIGGIFTGTDMSNSTFDNSKLRFGLPKAFVFNQESREDEEYFNLDISSSYMRDTAIEVPVDDRFEPCGSFEMTAIEFYYSSFIVERVADEYSDKCVLFMDRSWVIGSKIIGNFGWRCSSCTIAYSEVQMDLGLLVNVLTPVDGAISLKLSGANLKKFYDI